MCSGIGKLRSAAAVLLVQLRFDIFRQDRSLLFAGDSGLNFEGSKSVIGPMPLGHLEE